MKIIIFLKLKKKLKKGELFCIKMKNEDGQYKICLCISNDSSGIFYIDNIKIFNKQQLITNDYEHFTSNFDIKQNKNINEPYLSNDNLIETYYI